jgi:N-acetylmuramoyl-L-alanine amidase
MCLGILRTDARRQLLCLYVVVCQTTPLLCSNALSQTQAKAHQKSSQNEKKPGTQPAKTSTNKPLASTPAILPDNDFTSAKRKWALDVIVLDAGHGGKDAGTVGVTKTKEKDVALGVVKKLGALMKSTMPGTKVVYTRTDDTFVELDRRGQIANENGGKLFISIHCNSTPKKPSKASGFEVYILRPGRNEDAVRVAELENGVIKLEDDPKRYKPLTDEQFIVVSMAQSSFVRYSDMVAAMIAAEVRKLRDVGVRGVNQAGFLVLVGASMPNMLIETGFLSNRKEEAYLKSARGQTRLATAIFQAVKAYRVRYEAQMNVNAAPNVTKTAVPKQPTPKTATLPATKVPITKAFVPPAKKPTSSISPNPRK